MMETMEFEVLGKKDTRSGFGEGLLEIGRQNKNVVALCADLTGSLKMNAFQDEFPERFFQAGIAEANMMGMAAGMTIGGKIPFTGTFANFSTGRVYDQIRQSIAYSNKNVAITCSVDAIIPTWALMLVAISLQPQANMVVYGDLQDLENALFQQALSTIDAKDYEGAKVVVKGCGNFPVPTFAYLEVVRLLTPVVSSIMYGEPCSTVPLYKAKKK